MNSGPSRTDLDRAVAELREAHADFLEHLAGTFGDGRFRSAAALLRGRRAGRQAVDDEKAIEYARTLVRAGLASSAHHACTMAAKLFASAHQVDTMRDRLRRKFGRN